MSDDAARVEGITNFTPEDLDEMQRVISAAYEAWRKDDIHRDTVPWTRAVAHDVLTFRPDLAGRWS